MHLAERASDPNLCRLQSDMNALPLADASVETVWATAAAHHSWDLGATFREAARVLKPGGRLYFCCEPMPSWLRWPLGLAVGDAERELGIHETWVPRWRWLALARRAGFRVRLVFPELSDAQMAERLRARSVPDALAPALGALVRPALRVLQVSIHLVGRLET
ncbi:MAG: methyltransferase domain-containing protein [Acidobacteriota bacterium]